MKRPRPRTKKSSHLLNPFHYTTLIPEMQTEVRSQTSPAASVLLALTCKEEYHWGIQSKIIGSNDHLLLTALAQSRLDATFQHLCVCLERLIDAWKQGKEGPIDRRVFDKKWHFLVHMAISTGNLRLLEWLKHSPRFTPDWIFCGTECFQLAARHGDDCLLASLFQCKHVPGEAFNAVATELVRQNNGEKLRLFLRRRRGRSEAPDPGYYLDAVSDVNTDKWSSQWTNNERAIIHGALDWWDTYAKAFCHIRDNAWRAGKMILVLIYSMMSRQWTFAMINAFLDKNMQLERDAIIRDLPNDGRSKQELFWSNVSLGRVIDYALTCGNLDVLEHGLRQLPQCYWKYFGLLGEVVHFLYYKQEKKVDRRALGERLLLPIKQYINKEFEGFRHELTNAEIVYLFFCGIIDSSRLDPFT